MNLMNALKYEGKPFQIPDCSRNDLAEFFKEMDYKVGAEIGVFKGEFTEKFCKVGLKMYAIDPWRNDKNYVLKKPDEIYDEAVKILAPYNCKIIRKLSMDAVEDFEDESLDFVYLDGHHNFRYIAEDIFEWSKKVRKGGVVSGHDYNESVNNEMLDSVHVLQVVNAYIQAFRIRKFWVLGERYAPDRDKWRSWFFIK